MIPPCERKENGRWSQQEKCDNAKGRCGTPSQLGARQRETLRIELVPRRGFVEEVWATQLGKLATTMTRMYRRS